MKEPSRTTFVLIVVLLVTGAGFAYLARRAPVETAQTNASPSERKVDTVVGDETPFTPEW